MSDHEELADIIRAPRMHTNTSGDKQRAIADAILAAGYRKPRTITTAEELDALPVCAVVLVHGEIWQKLDRHEWRTPGSGTGPMTARELVEMTSEEITVLYVPEEQS